MSLDVNIPPNTQAVVYIPATAVESVTENSVLLSSSKEIKVKGKEGDYVVVELGSGNYHFKSAR